MNSRYRLCRRRGKRRRNHGGRSSALARCRRLGRVRDGESVGSSVWYPGLRPNDVSSLLRPPPGSLSVDGGTGVAGGGLWGLFGSGGGRPLGSQVFR